MARKKAAAKKTAPVKRKRERKPSAPKAGPDAAQGAHPDPTRPLAHARHELFAQGRAKGMDLAEAYRQAGFTGKQPKTAAAMLERRHPEVCKRVAAIKDAAARHVHFTLEDWLSEQLAILRSDRTSYWRADPETGHLCGLKPLAEWTPEQRAMVESIEISEHAVKLRHPAKSRALTELGRYLGAFEKDNAQKRSVAMLMMLLQQRAAQLTDLSDAELLELRAAIVEDTE